MRLRFPVKLWRTRRLSWRPPYHNFMRREAIISCPVCKSGKVAVYSRPVFVREALAWLPLLLLSWLEMHRFVNIIQQGPVTAPMAGVPFIAAALAVLALTKCIEAVIKAIVHKQTIYECRQCKRVFA